MRIAIILTGALRTIKKTIRFLRRNVLEVAGDQVDVYACLQNDTAESDASWREWFEGQIGGYLREVVWFSEAMTEWPVLRERLLKQIPIDDGWKGYLRSSGSMVEYYQQYLAYLKLKAAEQAHDLVYDYVIRCRTDNIFAKPVDFHWLKWSAEECGVRMHKIAEGLGTTLEDPRVFQMFMSTLWSDDVLPNVRHIMAENQPSPSSSRQVVTDEDIRRYIQEGRYVLTLRKNNMYLIRRDLFSLLPAGVATMYGTFRTKYSDDYWFNAEGQFRAACYEAGLAVYDYSTVFEEKSLTYAHSWQEDLFFNAAGELIYPTMLYCMVRK